MADIKKAKRIYDQNKSAYDVFLAEKVKAVTAERDELKERLEDQFFSRMIWKLLFIISLGVHVGQLLGGVW